MAAPALKMQYYGTHKGVRIYRHPVYQYFEAYFLDGYHLRTHVLQLIAHIDTKIPTKHANTSNPTNA